MSPGLTVAIISFNEEDMIRDCILSAGFADQTIVIDANSTDNTSNIAKSLNAEVYTYEKWEGFAIQRNRALTHCKHEYVFFLDCDERITPKLAEEIKQIVGSGQANCGLVRWENYVFGKKLRGIHETKGIQRLFKIGEISQFSGIVHEKAEIKDRTGAKNYYFKSKLIHHSRRNAYQSLLKLAQYSKLSSIRLRGSKRKGGVLSGVVHAVPKFINMYFFKLSFLSGAEGFLYCFLISLETFFKYCAAKYDYTDSQYELPKR